MLCVGHFERGGAFFDDVGDLIDGATRAGVDVAVVPSAGGAVVAEELGGMDQGGRCRREGEEKDEAEVMHFEQNVAY